MRPAIPRHVVIGLSLGGAILAVNAFIAWSATVSVRDATRAVEEGLRVEELLRRANASVADSEAAQRSYIISRKKEYLEYARDALKLADGGLNEIRALVGTDPADLKVVGSLQSSIAQRTAEFDDTLALLLKGDGAGALRAISTEASRHNLESAYELFDQIKLQQGELLTQRTRELQQSSYFSLATQNVATVFGLLFLSLIYYLVSREITMRRQTEEKLRVVATHDPLTALPNRTLLHERLSHALAKAQRHGRKLAALFIGLDRFKTVNDTLGHEAGDTLLQIAARRLYDCLRETDTMARQGGDEFVVLMDELGDLEPVSRVAQRILDAVAQPFLLQGRELHLSASIGISVYPDDDRTLLRNADIAMHRAKAKGGNGYEFYSSQLDNQAAERLELESGLRRALERDELTLHYQPKANLVSGQVSGMEALLRWQHPQLGWVSPAQFIPIAEETGLIVPIGSWVLRTACAQNKEWQQRGMRHIPVAVNLSPRQFAAESLLSDIKSALSESGLAPTDLEVEITESMVMNNPDQAVSVLRQIKELGVRVAIDDFGIGYSSLAYLKRFPIDTVKVDRSFVEDIPADENSMAIAQAVIAMAHSLRLKVVAEGVESEGQLSFLRGEGCDDIQGHYFCEARSASFIAGMMRKTLAPGVTTAYLAQRRRRA